jgi:hypothetical protein
MSRPSETTRLLDTLYTYSIPRYDLHEAYSHLLVDLGICLSKQQEFLTLLQDFIRRNIFEFNADNFMFRPPVETLVHRFLLVWGFGIWGVLDDASSEAEKHRIADFRRDTEMLYVLDGGFQNIIPATFCLANLANLRRSSNMYTLLRWLIHDFPPHRQMVIQASQSIRIADLASRSSSGSRNMPHSKKSTRV